MAEQEEKPPASSRWRVLFANLSALTGIVVLVRGLWMFSPAAALCVLGLLLLTGGILARAR